MTATKAGTGFVPTPIAALLGRLLNRSQWLFPSADYIDFEKGPVQGFTGQPGANGGLGVVALPAIGTQATILQFTVPKGRNGKVTAIGIDFVPNGGAALVALALPAPLTFTIQQNGTPFADLGSFNYLPGSVGTPCPIAGLTLLEGQVVDVLVTNNSLAVTTQFLACRLQGYFYNKTLAPSKLGYQ